MCCTILVHISATESLKNDDPHETMQDLPGSILQRRAIKENGTTNPVTIPGSKSMRFFALLIMCCSILVHISATESLKNEDARERRQELPRLNRERRALKKNGTTNPQDIEKRLQIIEQRLDALLSYPHGSYNALVAYLLGQKSQDKGIANKGPPGPPGPPGIRGPK
ncbi:uncharacterized protein LOC122947407, partial [Acropora millepora]|uniref:uncharacterized protein LOC122947407 n=1 Tax=Acropora millepora TaxID=45264 RepID=UPI001CF5456F